MLASIVLVGTLLGGLGLFILAIGMMTDGLKFAAGTNLRRLLCNWTNTPIRGIFSGFTLTAIVQSSSAVTVASIGFVNAGILTMRQSLGIIYGANVGTTVTSWLVAITGFKIDLHAFALPMIGVGMMTKLIKPEGRSAAFAMALVGFGLFFIGIDFLKSAFEGLVTAFDLSQLKAEGNMQIGLYLLVGVVMTVLTQSSSASIALTITAAASGLIGNVAAAAMVVGANVGTTSTAVLASIGATSQAKRVAAAQVIFNVATAIIALLILPILFSLITFIEKIMGLSADVAISLALFHSVFNILGVLLIFPFNNYLSVFLEKCFLSWEEQASHPKFLDKAIASTPDLAVNALILELSSIGERVAEFTHEQFKKQQISSVKAQQYSEIIRHLNNQVASFIVSLQTEALSEQTTQQLTSLMRVNQYFLNCQYALKQLKAVFEDMQNLDDADTQQALEAYLHSLTVVINKQQLSELVAVDELDTQQVHMQTNHDQIKAQVLVAGTRGQISVSEMSLGLDIISASHRLVRQWLKALRVLQKIKKELNHSEHNQALAAVE